MTSVEQRLQRPYTTAPLGRTGGRRRDRPADVTLHAKTYGTDRTLCGRTAITWPKYLDQPFERVTGPRCEICLALVRARFQ